MRLNIIKKCVNNMFLLLQTMAIVIVILWSYYYIYEKQHSIPFLDSCFWSKIVEDYWNIFVATATVVAAFWAYRAYMQSVKTRKHSSFDLLFTQLLSNMQSYINKATLQTTIVKAPWVKVYNRDYNTFLNFVNIYTEYMYITGQRILDEKKEITELWKVYTMNLVNRSDFSNCFKYIYHIVDTVCQSPLDDARRKQYIGIIQAQLNYDILFCYLINQIVYPYRNSNKEPYPKLLREYDFFKDLCKHGDYGAIIKSTINEDILKPFLHKKTLKSLFKKCMLLYHIMIDRFYPTNAEYKEREFNGGNIKGVIEKLDYVQRLGMNGIMLTPFYQTNEYHGYHITDYDKVDPHFGTWNDVELLVQEVHKRNMIIVADFVPNHCHISNSLYSEGKHKDWFLYYRKGEVKGFANLDFLPMFNTDNAEVQQYFIERGLKLCEVGFDAIRLDHATGPTYKFWRTFNAALKKQYPNVQIIGEVWGKLDFKPRNPFRYFWNKLRYSAQEARQMEYIGILDGVFDFRYQELICNAVKTNRGIEGNTKLKRSITKHFANYPSDFQLWLFLDNHDMNRFLFECNGNKKLLQEAIDYSKQWNRPFLTYYGTEKGMLNETNIHQMSYGDEQVRKPMIWD